MKKVPLEDEFPSSSISSSPQKSHQPKQRQEQLLVRFENKTHAITLDGSNNAEKQQKVWVLNYFADMTGWPINKLEIKSWDLPYVNVVVRSQILGGKGGFGTLLKGQSRQAGAKLTTDFGACRDLQGRRLRHVNDEIKLRKWREMERAKANGEKVEDDALWNTPSGIYNWHLMTPTWADISKKATYRIKRQFQKMDKEALRKKQLREEQEQFHQNSMKHYLEEATSASASIQENFQDALKQGLTAASSANKKRKRQQPTDASSSSSSDRPNSLCTLSGDMVVETIDKTKPIGVKNDYSASVQIQSKSDFATAVLVLDKYPAMNDKEKDKSIVVYYEVSLETGGMAQIGWACLVDDRTDDNAAASFEPNNELGDGVGDDNASYGVDGTRSLKFHAGQEQPLDGVTWKQGDRLGCFWNVATGELWFEINGSSQEKVPAAFTTPLGQKLVPAFSCNQSEILGIHTTREECQYLPKSGGEGGVRIMTVGQLLIQDDSEEAKDDKTKDGDNSTTEEKAVTDANAAAASTTTTKDKSSDVKQVEVVVKKAAAVFDTENIKPLDLNQYQSTQELENLGMDRLKGALMAIKVKCG